MQVSITQTPQPEEDQQYAKILAKLFPTRPLYIFLAVSLALLVLMTVQHLYNPSSRSLTYISISVLCLMLGGAILRATKKSLPVARERLMQTLGRNSTYTFTDDRIAIADESGECAEYARGSLVGQYCADKYYVFCLSDKGRMLPVIIRMTEDNLPSLNAIVADNARFKLRLKKLKL